MAIFGTDLSEAAIEKARAGIYSENITDEVSGERLRRYFTRLDQRYQIAKSLRDMCIFSRHDVTFDPPFSRLDLIACRNLLIYLDQPLQQRVLPLFHYALKPQGLSHAWTFGKRWNNFELFSAGRFAWQHLSQQESGGYAAPCGTSAERNRRASPGERRRPK